MLASYLIYALIVALLLYFMSDLWFEWRLGASTVASSSKAATHMLELVPEGRHKIVDFGSAWGGVVLMAARTRPDDTVVGIEYNFFPWLISSARAKLSGLRNLEIRRQDFFTYPLSDVTILLCYLPDPMMSRLSGKLEKELPPGALVISNEYPIPGWTPEKTVSVPEVANEKIFVYKMQGG